MDDQSKSSIKINYSMNLNFIVVYNNDQKIYDISRKLKPFLQVSMIQEEDM